MTICAYNVSGEPLGQPCPVCGHTGLVHPFVSNQVPHCLICELIQVIEEARP